MDEESIFLEALQKPTPADRAAFVERACAGNPQLRGDVERLLRAHERAGNFLQGNPGIATTDQPVLGGPGTVIGPYKLLEQIGEGGFGVVFMAEQQQPVRRKVALKVLKPGMDTRQVVARFEAERQALALMDHPNIAHVFDGGETGSGRPYFVMELVKGVPITDYCDQAQLTPRQRLELFLPVCQAVQHAHQKGIIHRDLKPNNVLVTLHDGTPVVKVIDFGIAKATGQQLTEKTLFTNFAQLIGTPLYMSPEQAALSGLDVDTRSDVYSLGVMLYELLTGTTPFDKERFRAAGYDEMRRIIREEEPPRPSTRISTLGRAATTLSTQRQSDPKRLSQLFRGELDWVVMKCLEKDRNRRYESASALAADVQRYLHHEPVLACPPTMHYRLRKLLRKHRGPVAASVSAALVLILAMIGLLFSNASITAQKKETEWALEEARHNYQAAEANLQLARKAVDDVYDQLADRFRDLPQTQSLEREFLHKVLNFYLEFAKRKSTDPEIRLGTAQAYQRVGLIRYKLNQHQQAEQSLNQAICRFQELATENPREAQIRLKLASAYHALGLVLAQVKGSRQAEQKLRSAIQILDQLVAERQDMPGPRINLAIANNSLGTLLHARPQEAERAHRKAITLCEKLTADFPKNNWYHSELVRGHYTLGLARAKSDRFQEAEQAVRDAIALFRQRAGPLNASQHRRLLPIAYCELAKVLHALGRPQEAKDTYREAIVLLEQYVANFPRISEYWVKLLDCHANLLPLLEQAGDFEEASGICRQALSLYERLAGQLPEEIADAAVPRIAAGLDAVLKNRSRPQDREQAYRRALEISEKLAAQTPTSLGYHFHAAYWNNALANLLTATGLAPEAARAYRKAAVEYGAAIELNPDHVPSLTNLAWLLAACPDPQFRDTGRAVRLAKRAAVLSPHTRHVWNTLGTAYYRAGDWQAAVTALDKSTDLDAVSFEGERRPSSSEFFLAMAYWRLGDKRKARQEYDRAIAWLEKHQPRDEEILRFRAEAEALLGVKMRNQ